MEQGTRFHRFDPITVRAAARVIRLGLAGGLPEQEVEYYVAQLAWTDPAVVGDQFRDAYPALRRLAVQRAQTTLLRAPRMFVMQRRSPGAAGRLSPDAAPRFSGE